MAAKEIPSPEIFIQSMAAWMQNNGLQLGNAPEDIDLGDSLKLAKIVGGIFTGLGGTPLFPSGGAKAEKVKRALEPFNRMADLVGLHIPHGIDASGQYMILVILADELSPRDILERFDLFTEFASGVAKLGWQIAFQSGEMSLYPLIVYFDSRKYARNAPKVLSNGWRLQFWKKINLHACAIDILQGKIEWAEMHGVPRMVEQAYNAVGINSYFRRFQLKDLKKVLLLAKKMNSTKRGQPAKDKSA